MQQTQLTTCGPPARPKNAPDSINEMKLILALNLAQLVCSFGMFSCPLFFFGGGVILKNEAAVLAQWLEHTLRNQEVVDLNPAGCRAPSMYLLSSVIFISFLTGAKHYSFSSKIES